MKSNSIFQLVEHLFHPFTGQGVFVTRLRSRENVEVLGALVFNQRPVQRGIALNDVHKVIHDATLTSHDEVEVTQADIEVDNDGFLPFWAKPVAMAALEVVLPTPPLPEVTTIMRAIEIPC